MALMPCSSWDVTTLICPPTSWNDHSPWIWTCPWSLPLFFWCDPSCSSNPVMIPLDILWMHNRFSSILLCRSLILVPITCSLQTAKHNHPVTCHFTVPHNSINYLLDTHGFFQLQVWRQLIRRRVILLIYHIWDSPESWQVCRHHRCISPPPPLTDRSAISSIVAPCTSFHEWTSTLFMAQICVHPVNINISIQINHRPSIIRGK